MDDTQLIAALAGESQGESPSADPGLITDAADIEEVLESGVPLSLEGEPEDIGGAADAGFFPPERDEFEAIRQQRDEAVAVLQAQQRQAQQQQAYQYWEGSRQQAEAAFAAQEKKIYQEAESAYDATAFIRDRMSALNQQREQWRQQYHGAREQSLRQAAERMAVPGFAQEVSNYYGLGPAETQELLGFPPQMMPQVAAIMARTQTQQVRSQAARTMSQRMMAPGSGRTSGRIKAGSDAHLYALLRGVAE